MANPINSITFVVPETSGTQSLVNVLSTWADASSVQHTILSNSATDSIEKIKGVLSAQQGTSQAASILCLVGAPYDIPHGEYPDDTGYDTSVLSDGAYTTLDSKALVPTIPVVRIPFTDPDTVQNILSQGEQLCPGWDRGLAVTAEVWSGASRGLLQEIGATNLELYQSPPNAEASIGAFTQQEPERLYFNVHGSQAEPLWVGESAEKEFPIVIRPETAHCANSAIVVSEACYGAAIYEGQGAMASSFLESGAGIFLGSTIIAWGASEAPGSCADILVESFFKHLDKGMYAARALHQAQQDVLQLSLERHGHLTPAEVNTVRSFVLYGSPLARCATAPAADDVLSRVRGRMRTGARDSGVLGRARSGVQSRIGDELYQVVSQGRLELSEIPAEFRAPEQLIQTLTDFGITNQSTLKRLGYSYGGKRYSLVSAQTSPTHKSHILMLDLDEQGAIIRKYLSK